MHKIQTNILVIVSAIFLSIHYLQVILMMTSRKDGYNLQSSVWGTVLLIVCLIGLANLTEKRTRRLLGYKCFLPMLLPLAFLGGIVFLLIEQSTWRPIEWSLQVALWNSFFPLALYIVLFIIFRLIGLKRVKLSCKCSKAYLLLLLTIIAISLIAGSLLGGIR